jgi:D-glycero-D-manno-heptose 1,7-bisphosphate phosphatase
LVGWAYAFLDRDGVIKRNAPRGDYIRCWTEFEFIPAIVDWIRLFNAMVIVVSNQRGVGRRLTLQSEIDDLHARMLRELNSRDAHIIDVFCCPHEYNPCDCRKPKPGLVLQAVREWNIDLERSILIGDSEIDSELAQVFGLAFIRVAERRIVTASPHAKTDQRTDA